VTPELLLLPVQGTYFKPSSRITGKRESRAQQDLKAQNFLQVLLGSRDVWRWYCPIFQPNNLGIILPDPLKLHMSGEER
jgi:hypothetical protein